MANIKQIKIGSTSYNLAATYDKNGKDITSTYLPLTGGTLTGTLTIGGGTDLLLKAASGNDSGDLVFQNSSGTEVARLWYDTSQNLLTHRYGANKQINSFATMVKNTDIQYWGLKTPTGGDDWIRTTTQGIIPYQAGAAGSGHGSLGTSTWYFSAAYIDNIYGYLNGNISGSSASCRGNAATATSATSATKSNKLASTGFGNASPGELTYYASSSAFAGYSGGWAHYLIANHGNGSNYYNWIMILPFGGSPLYRRMNGGAWQDFQYFITTENYKTYQNKLYNTFNDNIATVGTYCQTKGSVLSFEPCDEVSSYNINLGRNTSGKKFNNIYLKASAINGSDIRLKKDLSKLLDDERYIQLFDLIEPYAYKFIDGTSGRIHTGFISQYVEDAMKEVGLNSSDCAFFCKDIETKSVYDESGNIIKTEPILDENGNIVYNYALRYGEYIAITAAKIKSLEKKYNQEIDELKNEIKELKRILLKEEVK